MRFPTSALVAAALFAASLAPAGAAYHLPAAGSLVIQKNIASKIVPRSDAGKYVNPSAVPLKVKQAAAKRQIHLPKLHEARVPGAVTGAVTDDFGYIFWLSGKKVAGYATDCSGAEGAKTDHNGNVWVACTNTSTINEYAPGATSATLTLVDNPGGVYYYTADVAVDSAGDVWASSLYAFSCTTYYCYFYPGQISFWAASNVTNGASPSGTVADANINEEAFFVDVNPAGSTAYVDYYGCGTYSCGYAADMISGTSVSTFIPFGGLSFPGMVYYTGAGNVEVLDQLAIVITEYSAGGVADGNFSGPLPENLEFTCDPVSGGYNSGDSMAATGDAGCHSQDVGKLAAHHGHGAWKANANINFALPIGSVFVPSDK